MKTRQNPPLQALFALIALLACAAPVRAQFAREHSKSDLMDYIQGAGANPACGVCLGAANKYLDDKEKEEIAKLTAGMAYIPAGRYKLGSPATIGDPDERPAEEIALDAFFIDKTEVTLKDYKQFTKATSANHPEWDIPGGRFNLATGNKDYYKRLAQLIKTCPTCPVFGVKWDNANAYCLWKKRRLPTEAEWEAAARAGSDAPYPAGETPTGAGEFAWIEDNSKNMPHPVAQKRPNRYGLYDMYGNMWEWVHDFYDKGYYPMRLNSNPDGPKTGKEHTIRGGSWSSDSFSARPANRASSRDANDDIGFRCAVSENILSEQRGSGF